MTGCWCTTSLTDEGQSTGGSWRARARPTTVDGPEQSRRGRKRTAACRRQRPPRPRRHPRERMWSATCQATARARRKHTCEQKCAHELLNRGNVRKAAGLSVFRPEFVLETIWASSLLGAPGRSIRGSPGSMPRTRSPGNPRSKDGAQGSDPGKLRLHRPNWCAPMFVRIRATFLFLPRAWRLTVPSMLNSACSLINLVACNELKEFRAFNSVDCGALCPLILLLFAEHVPASSAS